MSARVIPANTTQSTYQASSPLYCPTHTTVQLVIGADYALWDATNSHYVVPESVVAPLCTNDFKIVTGE
jgi:hypothetical protein